MNTSEAPEIRNYDTYNHRMELSMLDKMFFVDKIQPDLIVDFGCADAVLLKAIHQLKPTIKLVGFDNDPNMLKFGTPDIDIFSDWAFIQALLDEGTAHINADRSTWFEPKYKSSALILSSVMHEVFHYGSKHDIDSFWKKVLESGFDYIIIRDMLPSRGIDRVADTNDVKKVYHKFLGTKALDDFERVWGSIENNKQLIHFLLKYKYLEPNWEREVRENYLPLTRETLLSKIPLEYDVIYHEHFVLPYLWQTVKQEVGIEIKDPTHLKLILKRNK